jgi:hypothetical protein
MAVDMTKVKNHPAFIAFRGGNVKSSAENTQLKDSEEAKQEVKSDSKYADKGGE